LQTQLLHHLCVQCQLGGEDGGANGKVIFLDTEGAFRPERVAQIALERHGLEKSEVMENILHAHIGSHEILMSSMTEVAAMLSDPEKGPFKMLIVDSLMHNFRTEFSGRGGLTEDACFVSSLISLAHFLAPQ
jgi:meiotic recombination protein DMC1